ncbi:hypothetical protein [Streptosporangium sp. NPDC001681]|uniref:hypothetical protein n=1 Tax=Streptosporangium sp. NPDC001681 TaxID=3154395 RepID=UPI00332090B0
MDLSEVEHKRLTAVTAARFTHESEIPEILHVWLHLETAIVRVHVGPDWTFRITPDELEESYVMEELGSRVDVISAPREVPFVRHIGERLGRVTERFDDEDPAQCMGAESVFETGSVLAWSFGGDLHMADR